MEGAEYNEMPIPPGAYEVQKLKKEIKQSIIEESYTKEEEYPSQIKPNFSTLGSFIKIQRVEVGKILLFQTFFQEIS